MKKKKIEQQVAQSFSNAQPDIYNSVAADCPTRAAAVAKPKNTTWGWKIATCALSLLLVVAIVFGGVMLGRNSKENAVAASVTLDVNPSVSIQINSNRRVVKVEALNKDGLIIVGNKDFKGVQLELAVDAIIGSMFRHNYIRTDANSVLVSVDAAQNEYDELVKLISDEITVELKGQEISVNVVSQWIRSSDAASKLAAQYGISLGKAQLITKILDNAPEGSTYKAEDLVTLTVNELMLLMQNLDIPSDVLSQSGSANDPFVGSDVAKASALERAGLDEQAVTRLTCQIDNDDGLMVYEVEFVCDGWEYEINVNARTGEVVKFDKELARHTVPAGERPTGEQVLAVALEKAGLPEGTQVTSPQVSFNEKDKECEVNFSYNGTLYEMEIGYDLELISYQEKTVPVLPELPPENQWLNPSVDNELVRALLEFLNKKYGIDITLENTHGWEIEKETEHGRTTYDIEFKWRDYSTHYIFEFECEMDSNMNVLSYERERVDSFYDTGV